MIIADTLFLSFSPLVLFACAVAMIVLRAGASRIFFDIVGTMQAEKLIKDSKANATIMEALYLDALAGIQEGFLELGSGFSAMADDVMPIGKEIGEAARQFEKFVSAGEDIDELNAQVIEIGNSFGFSADQAFDAAAKMAQLAGVLGAGSTATGTEVGMAFGMISGMSTEAAMQRMVNLQQQTGFMTEGIHENTGAMIRNNMIRENSFRIMDQLNTIENTSVATMSQLTFVMNQFASQANLTGESIAAMAAMSAVLIESGEEQGKAGRALRMVYARLGADTAGARKAIEDLGIAVIDSETGAMRPLSEILIEVQDQYQGMTGQQKQNLAQTIAGNVHYTRLIKLLENTSRMQDLHTDALERAFPAQEEIDRLQQSNLFTLEQMEAKLKDAKGALAEELMPAMTDSAKVQMVFFDTMAQAAARDGAIGSITRGFFRMSEMMRTVIGPFAQQILSVMHLRIATETLNHVKRAMNKEDMFNLSIGKHKVAQEQELTTRLDNHRMSIQAMIQERGRDASLVKAQIALYDQKAAKIDALTFEQHEFNAATQAGSAAVNTLSMGFGVLGSGMMMLSGSQKSIRTGMILNTFAMTIQVAKLMASSIATTVNSIAMMGNTGATLENVIATKAKAAADTAAAAAANVAALATRNFMLSLGVIGGLLVAAGFLANKLAGSFTDVSDSVDMANASFVDIGDTVGIVNDMSMDEIQANIDATQVSVDNLKGAEDSLGKTLLQNHEAELKRFEDAKKLKILQSQDAKDLALLMDEANKLPTGEGYFTGPARRANNKREKALNKLKADYGDLFKTLDDMGIDSSATLAEFNIGNLEGMANNVGEFTDSIGDSFTEAEDTMHSFNNAREELFFGFSSSNLTGDLIRQVQQQGVENLITNTEVIMTNNFNGMTVPEVADQILEEIESRANLSGISLSMSAA